MYDGPAVENRVGTVSVRRCRPSGGVAVRIAMERTAAARTITGAVAQPRVCIFGNTYPLTPRETIWSSHDSLDGIAIPSSSIDETSAVRVVCRPP